MIVVADCMANNYLWYGSSLDLSGYISYAESILASWFPLSQESTAPAYDVLDITSVTDMTRSLTQLITIFLYGFVSMLALIGLTSVISAISANVQLRSREFAMLRSAGMTQGGVRRMLALESMISALKALLFGVPLGSAAMYLTYLAVTESSAFEFVYPWHMLPEVILGVFLITLLTTQYAALKLRNKSIIESIRSGDGL